MSSKVEENVLITYTSVYTYLFININLVMNKINYEQEESSKSPLHSFQKGDMLTLKCVEDVKQTVKQTM